MQAGDWLYSVTHEEPCRLMLTDRVWGETVYTVWLPRRDALVRVSEGEVAPLDGRGERRRDEVVYAAAAARIADALERDVLIAPLEGTVIPLPHQLRALQRAVGGDRVRYLLADEVGLGKTVEAGLILRELKVRGLARRILVVAPAGLVTQWVSEMRTHFNEEFRLLMPGEFATWRRIVDVDDDQNLWKLHDQVVCSLDSVKPMDSRQGWSRAQVDRYNRERFEDLVTAGWDLIIIDEAHRLGGSTETVARYRLGEALSQAAPYLLLLSATPHQGKTDAFRRLLGFLDREAFPEDDLVRRETVAPFVIRTEKRRAIDADGNPLFKPRRTRLLPVCWTEDLRDQRVLYDAVTDYVREGYNQALKEKRQAVGFLMILMQRLVTSSVRAIRTTLERRLEVLSLPVGQLSLFSEDVGEDWASLDSQEQMEALLSSRLMGLRNERAEVELLLSAARRCEAKGPDVKAQALLDEIHRIQREENDPDLKVLIFTEFVATQEMLAEFLGNRGFSVACLNGSMNLDERQQAQRTFASEARVLISTDAGGEGLNLQFAHVVFNYDLPWNPMKLEQRIGRVDRIGQTHVVQVQNFALEDTVELRVREVLEEKLQRILEEFGIDKLADVLDSEEGGVDFDELYIQAVLTPEEAEARADGLARRIRERAQAAREGASVLGATEDLDPEAAKRIAGHQVSYWTERMTLAWLRAARNAEATVEPDTGYRLLWPDGLEVRRAVFSREEAERPGTFHFSLEHPRVRGLLGNLPQHVPGQPLPAVVLPGLSEKVTGTWSLWRISLRTAEGTEQRMLPVFLTPDGRVLGPTARAVWDRLLDLDGDTFFLAASVTGERASALYDRARVEAEGQGHGVYLELLQSHSERLRREREKGERSFEARRRAIETVGLPQVRRHRLRELQAEQAEWSDRLRRQEAAIPELTAILMVRIAGPGEMP